jgi:Ca2+-binding RTX toxin-like protein
MATIFKGTTKNDILKGTLGADILQGLAGNDTYIVNHKDDKVAELTRQGTDTIQSSVTYIMPNHVENLTLTGTAAIHSKGNALNNILSGNANSNILNGLAGNDTVRGNGGNDKVYGGDGDDNLFGGAGNNILRGGLGQDDYNLVGGNADTLIIAKGESSMVIGDLPENNDVVVGFGINDKFDLDGAGVLPDIVKDTPNSQHFGGYKVSNGIATLTDLNGKPVAIGFGTAFEAYDFILANIAKDPNNIGHAFVANLLGKNFLLEAHADNTATIVELVGNISALSNNQII